MLTLWEALAGMAKPQKLLPADAYPLAPSLWEGTASNAMSHPDRGGSLRLSGGKGIELEPNRSLPTA